MIPQRYEGMTFDSWVPPTSEDPRPLLQRWVSSPERPWSLVFLGPAGTGKTHLACATFRELPGWPWWIDATEAISQLREDAVNGYQANRTAMEYKLLDKRPILIDDFGCTRLTDFAHEKWMYTLCHRYNHMLPTIITSNAEKLEAFDIIDPRITSRLHEGLVITLTGSDRRAA